MCGPWSTSLRSKALPVSWGKSRSILYGNCIPIFEVCVLVWCSGLILRHWFFFVDINITSEDLQSLYRLMAEEISPITKVNIIRIIALVASRQLQHKANHTQFSPILEQITTFFLESYQKESKDLVFRAEVLDSLIDIYAEDEQITLELIRKLNLISVLRNIATDYLKEVRTWFCCFKVHSFFFF